MSRKWTRRGSGRRCKKETMRRHTSSVGQVLPPIVTSRINASLIISQESSPLAYSVLDTFVQLTEGRSPGINPSSRQQKKESSPLAIPLTAGDRSREPHWMTPGGLHQTESSTDEGNNLYLSSDYAVSC